MTRYWLPFCILFAILMVSSSSSRADEPLRFPPDDELNAAILGVRSAFEADFKRATTATAQTALAKKLVEQSGQATEPTEVAALLVEAVNVAGSSGVVRGTLDALDQLESRFEGIRVDLLLPPLTTLTEKLRFKSEAITVGKRLCGYAGRAVHSADFVSANAFVRLSLQAARASGDPALIKVTSERLIHIEELGKSWEKIQPDLEKAVKALDVSPTDPAANLLVGTTYCFTLGNWSTGLSHLALAEDSAIKALAVRDLEEQTTPTNPLEIADQWWDLASEHPPAIRRQIRLRAARWYRRATPELSGLALSRAESRTNEVDPFDEEAERTFGWPKSLIAYWRAEGDGKEMISGRDAELQGAAGYGPGIAGQGFRLDGGNSHVVVSDHPSWDFGTGPFTLALWVKLNSIRPSDPTGLAHVFVAQDEGPGERPKWVFYFSGSSGKLGFHVNGPEKGSFIASSNANPRVGAWHHYAMSRNGTNYEFFFDGKSLGRVPGARLVANPTSPLDFGFAEVGGHLEGVIDEVMIFHESLDAAKIQELYKFFAK